MTDVPDPIGEREESLRVQLAGASSAVSAAEAADGIATARAEVGDGRGSGYGVGFGLIKNFGYDGDRVRLLFAISDDAHEANLFAFVSGSKVASLEANGENLIAWSGGRLYEIAGTFARDGNRYIELLLHEPLSLG